jgi:hypothetical protein
MIVMRAALRGPASSIQGSGGVNGYRIEYWEEGGGEEARIKSATDTGTWRELAAALLADIEERDPGDAAATILMPKRTTILMLNRN